MYKSLKEWINVPVSILRFKSHDGAGDEVFEPVSTIYAYPLSDITVVRNNTGIEVTSNTQLIVDGTTLVADYDRIIFEGSERPVQAIRTFYRNGVPDIKVVYL